MKVVQSLVINASPEQVWDLLSGEYGTFHKWCIGAAESESLQLTTATPKAKDGSTARKLTRPDGVTVVETIEEYSNQERRFQYKVEGGLPGFIVDAHTEWKVETVASDDTSCKLVVTFHGNMKTFPGIILDPLFSYVFLPGVFKQICQSCKHYVETGAQSDVKRKETEKYLQQSKK